MCLCRKRKYSTIYLYIFFTKKEDILDPFQPVIQAPSWLTDTEGLKAEVTSYLAGKVTR